jgi:hypothetical protein
MELNMARGDDNQSVSSDDSRISVSSNQSSYGDIRKGVKQSELIPKAITRMKGFAEYLPQEVNNNSVTVAAGEILKVLEKGDEDALELAAIINQSDKVDLYKACEKLHDDIQNVDPLSDFHEIDDKLKEEKILENLPKRIEEAESERTFNFKRLKNVTEKFVQGGEGRFAILKEEFGKMNRARKAVAAGVAAAAVLVSPAVLGVGLAASCCRCCSFTVRRSRLWR